MTFKAHRLGSAAAIVVVLGLLSLLGKSELAAQLHAGGLRGSDARPDRGYNTTGNQNGMGNPGNHPFRNLPDGQVCLP